MDTSTHSPTIQSCLGRLGAGPRRDRKCCHGNGLDERPDWSAGGVGVVRWGYAGWAVMLEELSWHTEETETS